MLLLIVAVVCMVGCQTKDKKFIEIHRPPNWQRLLNERVQRQQEWFDALLARRDANEPQTLAFISLLGEASRRLAADKAGAAAHQGGWAQAYAEHRDFCRKEVQSWQNAQDGNREMALKYWRAELADAEILVASYSKI
jgi:hypothetical protein